MSFAAAYLRSADRFFASASSGYRGADSISIDFVGGPYRFTGLDPALADSLRLRYGDYATAPGAGDEPMLEMRVRHAPGDAFVDTSPRPGEYHIGFEFRTGAVHCAASNFAGRIDWNAGLAGTLWIPDGEIDAMQTAVENFFRIVAAYRLLDLGGVLLHSAGVTDEARTWVFYGRSGAGKSTISRIGLRSGRRVLSDDMNALVPGSSGFEVHQVPFAGDLGQTAGGRPGQALTGIMKLAQGHADRLTPTTPGEALASMIVCAPIVNNDPARSGRLFANLSRLIEHTRVERLMFSLDGRCWDLIGNTGAE